MLEKEIENWLGKKVEALGGINLKFVSPGSPGVPDRIFILPNGEIWFVELKQQLGKASGIQKWWRKRFQAMGCNYRLVRGIEEARQFVEELKDEIHTA